ncbi:MAG: hypothetical protein CM15mP74_03940 [Halieaceae bacterium]|nr:MAG: hypothetical protein CM15mP74_03940 [Halieaceae bacterium]
MSFSEWDQRCMTLALEEAQRAADRGEVPVGAVLTPARWCSPMAATRR